MNKSSETRLTLVHPELSARIHRAATSLLTQGISIEVVQGLRTYAEQDALYAQGRTKPGRRVTNARGGQSNHNFGLAVDVCPFVAQQPDWNAPHATWVKIGDAGKAEGLEWGGDWISIRDNPHLQLPGLQLAECRSLYASGGLAAVWAAAVPESAA
jgi:peptidoglycan L-alanyl-D-glutamate endopeptidase CwlK